MNGRRKNSCRSLQSLVARQFARIRQRAHKFNSGPPNKRLELTDYTDRKSGRGSAKDTRLLNYNLSAAVPLRESRVCSAAAQPLAVRAQAGEILERTWQTFPFTQLGSTMSSGTLRILLFVVISLWLAYVSRKSLRVAGSHGFYRFFAWEALVALVLLNIDVWFSDPLSIRQIISWIFLLVSLALLGAGVHFIRVAGNPSGDRQDATLYTFEKTSALVTSGIYAYIRHPLYGSLMFLAWGAFLKEVTWYSVGLASMATLFLVATAKADEAECIRFFGSSYKDYMRRTKMFIPLCY